MIYTLELDPDIEFNIEEDDIVCLFGEIFIENNYDKCKMILNNDGIERDLKLYLELASMPELIEEKELEVKLVSKKPLNNLSYMFNNCFCLKRIKGLKNIEKLDLIDITNMFNACYSLKELPESLAKMIIKHVSNISSLFCNCCSLKKLPDISKWDLENVEDISYLFAGCEKLEYIPDNIKNWKTSKIKTMNCLFTNCRKLKKIIGKCSRLARHSAPPHDG